MPRTSDTDADYDFIGMSDCDSVDSVDNIDSMGASATCLAGRAAGAINPAGAQLDNETITATNHDAFRAPVEPAKAPDDGHPDPGAAVDNAHQLDSAHDVAHCARDNSPAPAPPPFLTPSVPPCDGIDEAALVELPNRIQSVRDATDDHVEHTPLGAENACQGAVAPLHWIAPTVQTSTQADEDVSDPDRAAPVPYMPSATLSHTCAARLADAPTMDPAVHLAVPLFGCDGDVLEHRVVVVTVSPAQARSLVDVVAAISADTVVDGDIKRGDAYANGVDDADRHGDAHQNAVDGLYLDGDAHVHENAVGDGHVDGNADTYAMGGGYIHDDSDPRDHRDNVDNQD
ncbi:hypothetical protein GGF31_008295 [Allomyces arbusculus]|nr:hypothetical protein GGF31_008295 [Allomyces arbusculus]